MADNTQLSFTAYTNRSGIKKFLKWLALAVGVFAFFVYLVVATVIAAIVGSLQPPKTTIISSSNQRQQAPLPKTKH